MARARHCDDPPHKVLGALHLSAAANAHNVFSGQAGQSGFLGRQTKDARSIMAQLNLAVSRARKQNIQFPQLPCQGVYDG